MESLRYMKELAHESRLRIVALLRDHELCVCELEDILGIRQVNISKHLNRLKQAGIVDSRREKQRMFYFLSEAFQKEESLLRHIAELTLQEPLLQADRERFLRHEETKDTRIYVCNVFKKENLT